MIDLINRIMERADLRANSKNIAVWLIINAPTGMTANVRYFCGRLSLCKRTIESALKELADKFILNLDFSADGTIMYRPGDTDVRSIDEKKLCLDEQKPAIQEPAIQKPAIQKPAIQEPAIQKPAIQEPIVLRLDEPEKPANRLGSLCASIVQRLHKTGTTSENEQKNALNNAPDEGIQGASVEDSIYTRERESAHTCANTRDSKNQEIIINHNINIDSVSTTVETDNKTTINPENLRTIATVAIVRKERKLDKEVFKTRFAEILNLAPECDRNLAQSFAYLCAHGSLSQDEYWAIMEPVRDRRVRNPGGWINSQVMPLLATRRWHYTKKGA